MEKKKIVIKQQGEDWCQEIYCPNCDQYFPEDYWDELEECFNCGQELDWS